MNFWEELRKFLQKKTVRRWLRFAPVGGLFGGIGIHDAVMAESINQEYRSGDHAGGCAEEYSQLVSSVRDLEKRQQEQKMLVSDADLNRQLSLIEIDAAAGNFPAARTDAQRLRSAVANWNYEMSGQVIKANQTADPTGGTYLPILMYHYPPPDFEAQLTHLEQAGYTTVDLDQAEAGLHGGPLAEKAGLAAN